MSARQTYRLGLGIGVAVAIAAWLLLVPTWISSVSFVWIIGAVIVLYAVSMRTRRTGRSIAHTLYETEHPETVDKPGGSRRPSEAAQGGLQ